MFLRNEPPQLPGLPNSGRALWRFCLENNGQDLVEYAFLAGFLATAGMLALNAIGVSILDTYSDWMDPTIGVPSLWAPPEPPSGS